MPVPHVVEKVWCTGYGARRASGGSGQACCSACSLVAQAVTVPGPPVCKWVAMPRTWQPGMVGRRERARTYQPAGPAPLCRGNATPARRGPRRR